MPRRWQERLAALPVAVLHGVALTLLMVGSSTLIHLAVPAFDLDT